jgi:small subunit ribosomal protein S7
VSRRRVSVKRKVLPDAKYGSVRVAKFVNVIMTRGKKSVAERLVYGAMAHIEQKSKRNPVEVLEAAMTNVTPAVEVKSRRIGGANYQVPVEVRALRGAALAMRWLRDAMRAGGDKSTVRNLAQSLLEASDGQGVAVKKRDDTHRMAAANKAFSHFRF